MWVATRYAARRAKPVGPIEHGALTTIHGMSPDEATAYLTLARRHPQVPLGPDQDPWDHLRQLRAAESTRTRKPSIMDRPATLPAIPEESAPSPTSNLGLPQRIPGLNTGDNWAHPDVPDEWRPRPLGLPNRTPGTHYVDPALQAARPAPQQTMDQWKQFLADKGIYLDADGRRMTPEQMVLPKRHPSSQQNLRDFTASRAYVAKVLGR
jgi:hypothetical protein